MLNPATEADLPQAVALINASYRGESSRRGWTHEADYIDGERTTLATLQAELADSPLARLLLWRDEPAGPLLGCVWLEPRDDRVWYLGLLTVRPDMQDKRLGQTILAEAEAVVRESGGTAIQMTVVHLRTTLLAWYQRRGYALTGDTQPFPHGDPPRDDLHFVMLRKML